MSQQFLYNLNYSEYEEALCAIEIRAIFRRDLDKKIFVSNIEFNPSESAFIKNRLELRYGADSFENLLEYIVKDTTIKDGYRVKYIKLMSGDDYAAVRNTLCKKITDLRPEQVDYKNPDSLYGITYYEDTWYFGLLIQNNNEWKKHDKRPYTYSNSLKINMAKVLINLAGQGDKTKTIIDPCCGAGTVLLEGCFAGYRITGTDISWKTAKNARENLAHFGYKPDVCKMDIQDIQNHYDSAIVDLPYGLYSQTTPEDQLMILCNAKRIAKRIVIISSTDISEMIQRLDLKVIDTCALIKTVNREFTRYINICEILPDGK